MRTRTRVLMAGAALTVVLIGVPTVALADSGPNPSTSSSTSARTCVRPVAAYLSAHPDVATELQTLKELPQDQRAAARTSWAQAHQEEATGLRQARQEGRADRLAGLEAANTYAAAHPDVSALLDQLQKAPVGSRAATVRQYVAAHPGTRSEIKGLRAALRQAVCGS
jgi:heme-binding protein